MTSNFGRAFAFATLTVAAFICHAIACEWRTEPRRDPGPEETAALQLWEQSMARFTELLTKEELMALREREVERIRLTQTRLPMGAFWSNGKTSLVARRPFDRDTARAIGVYLPILALLLAVMVLASSGRIERGRA